MPIDIAFSEGAATMWTGIVDCVTAALNPEERDCSVANPDCKARFIAQVRFQCDAVLVCLAHKVKLHSTRKFAKKTAGQFTHDSPVSHTLNPDSQ